MHSQGEMKATAAVTREIHVAHLGTTTYQDVHSLQKRLQARRRDGEGVDTLLLTEHRPVFTLGRSHPKPDLRVPPEAVRRYGIDIVQTERGGDITYHGPGQLVAYGIIDLQSWQCGVIDYVNALEDTAIAVLADWGVTGERDEHGRGVWVGGRKIASIGLNVRRWVTMHGIALNIDPDMSHFDLINPCGMADVEMSSLSAETRKRISFEDVSEKFVARFAETLGCTVMLKGQPGWQAPDHL